MTLDNRILEIARGIDGALRRLDDYRLDLRELKQSLDSYVRCHTDSVDARLELLDRKVESLTQQLVKHGVHVTSNYEQDLARVREILNSPAWPAAVEADSICDQHEDKIARRAEDICSLIVQESLTNKRFLDFGCGDGSVVNAAKKWNPAVAMGLDTQAGWTDDLDGSLTQSFNVAVRKGPYDVVLLYDVIDHADIEPPRLLESVRTLLAAEGTIYMRCHPWCSRHGSHHYSTMNKAFFHLALDEAEMVRIAGSSKEMTRIVYRPLETYRDWIAKAGLSIVSEIPILEDVEPFFSKPGPVRDRIFKHWNGESPLPHMKISHVDYVLKSAFSEERVL